MKSLKVVAAIAFLTTSTMSSATFTGAIDALKSGNLESAFTQFFNKNTLTEITAPKAKPEAKATPKKGTDFSAVKAEPKKKPVNKSELNIQEMEDFFKNTFDSIGSMLNQK